MKYLLLLLLGFSLFLSCEDKKEISSIDAENWEARIVDLSGKDSLEHGKSYLSVYSQIYSRSERMTHNLTAMISMRNTSETDSIYLTRAEYFDTHGTSIRKYFKSPIYLAPMETTEIIIDEVDVSGGTGSNFILEWKIPRNTPEPLFECIMTSTMGQQGLSFTTQAKRIQ